MTLGGLLTVRVLELIKFFEVSLGGELRDVKRIHDECSQAVKPGSLGEEVAAQGGPTMRGVEECLPLIERVPTRSLNCYY